MGFSFLRVLVSYGVEVFAFETAMGVLGPYHVSYMLSVFIFSLSPDEIFGP